MSKLVTLTLTLGLMACGGTSDRQEGACYVSTTNNGMVCLGDDLTVDECIEAAASVSEVVLDANGEAEQEWTADAVCEDGDGTDTDA